MTASRSSIAFKSNYISSPRTAARTTSQWFSFNIRWRRRKCDCPPPSNLCASRDCLLLRRLCNKLGVRMKIYFTATECCRSFLFSYDWNGARVITKHLERCHLWNDTATREFSYQNIKINIWHITTIVRPFFDEMTFQVQLSWRLEIRRAWNIRIRHGIRKKWHFKVWRCYPYVYTFYFLSWVKQ